MKTVFAAILAASMLVLPAVPASARTLTAAEKDCLVFPMLKKQCWQMAADKTDATIAAVDMKVPVRWWECTRAPEGSGHLLDC